MQEYFFALLYQGYGFDMDSRQVLVVDQVNGHDMGWALGAILYQANSASWQYVCDTPVKSDTVAKKDLIIAVSIMAAVILALAAAFIITLFKYNDMRHAQIQDHTAALLDRRVE